MLNDAVLEYIGRSVLCWLATVDVDGAPNVSPKEIFTAFGRHTLLVANIASPTTVRNIRANSRVCVSFVDVFVQKGYKLRGVAEVVKRSDSRYAELEAPLVLITGGVFPIHSVIAIQVTAVEPIVAPSYRWIPGTTEASQVAGAWKTYGVLPMPSPV